ncbi:MAG TPA: HlyD family efflux transporter periplasmic adaptor subunit, partial [Saprospiraceae bacterium]|nr:HlyD family efflux transporter periplasmic adaptor subunit [Saprospiraceae bacterium]
AQARYDKELTLLNRGVLTREELNPTRIERDSYERQVQDVQSSIRSKSNQISMLRDRSRSNSGRAKALEDQSAAFGLLKDSFARLRNRVSEWKREYTVESPISGTVLFAKDNLAKGQFVQRDSLLLVIVPGKASGTVAKMEIVPEEAGQIVRGQKVQIKLYDYPFPDYGAVWGQVEGKGKLPSGGKIPVEVRFPGDSLVTTKAGLIQPEGEMRGKATIILSRRRLIQRIFGIGEG